MAIGAMQEAAVHGLRVPDDLSIVGFDGIDAATWTNPPLTTVEQPIDEIARTAVEALWGQVARPTERQPSYVFRPRLRPGGTTCRAVERAHDVVEVVVPLVRDAPLVQVLGEAIAREDASRRLRDAAIGEPVSDVDEVTEARDIGALARLATDRTRLGVAKDARANRRDAHRAGWRRTSSSRLSRSSTGSMSSWKPLETTSGR